VISQFGSGIYNFKTRVAFANENRVDVHRQRKKQWSVSAQASQGTLGHHLRLTSRDFFLWGFIKYRVLVPPLPATLVDLRTRITAAITVIDNDMLQSVW
jgi:hypothetical protein